MQEEEGERRVIGVTCFVLRPVWNRAACFRASGFCWLCPCLPSFSFCLVPCCGCRLDRLRSLCALFVGPRVARTSVAHPCVSVQVGFQRFSVPNAFVNVAMSAQADGLHGHTSRRLHFVKSLTGSLQTGSVVKWVWGRVLEFLLDLLGECFAVAIPKSLMGSLEVGSVVTWGGGPKSLMLPMDDGSVVAWRVALESDDCGVSSFPVTGKCASGYLVLSRRFFVKGVIHTAELFFQVQASSGAGKLRRLPGNALLIIGLLSRSLAQMNTVVALA